MPSITSIKKERAERLFRGRQEGVHAASAYEAKEQATRLLTAKLRDERLAREVMSASLTGSNVAKERSIIHIHPVRAAHKLAVGVTDKRTIGIAG